MPGTVTHYNQPAIHKTHGHVYAGNAIPYTVSALLWPKDVTEWISRRLVSPSLSVCCGKSTLGDVRLDLFEAVDVRADGARLPFCDKAFPSVVCDPPYNGVFQWNHDLLSELGRVASQRIIFQHWFCPVDRKGNFKKDHRFYLSELAAWQPRTYFGRAQLLTVLDVRG